MKIPIGFEMIKRNRFSLSPNKDKKPTMPRRIESTPKKNVVKIFISLPSFLASPDGG